MKNKKGQEAMEFLMTYGWAILVVLIAIGALAYFGVLNPDRFLPDKNIVPAFEKCNNRTSDVGKVFCVNKFYNDNINASCIDSARFYNMVFSKMNIESKSVYLENHVFNVIDLENVYCIVDMEYFDCTVMKNYAS